MIDFLTLAQQCAPVVDPHTMAAVVRVESSFNPYAIGIVHARLVRQPRNLAEALATAHALDAQGYTYSVGLAQIKRTNLAHYGLSLEGGFEPCTNLWASSKILASCFQGARNTNPQPQQALRIALSCYYSGNKRDGFTQGYVQKVVTAANNTSAMPIPLVPALQPQPSVNSPQQSKASSDTTTQHNTTDSTETNHNPANDAPTRDPRDAQVF
ncbi:lytic transglycosylase domain-containing protein [Trinickia acidisoli]|uniref:lytic transglycosylase domain-containing protein n=1 Tax=Trinickia acidisoli TaxID=2767482 RepID=UPI001A8D1217|nr:lytic transglycosylase domain-containing protein [Trinickia acidisoli]